MITLFFDKVAPIQLHVLDALHSLVECKNLLGKLQELPAEACAQHIDLAAIYQQAAQQAQRGLELSKQLVREARPDVEHESITELNKLSTDLNLVAIAAYTLLPEELKRQSGGAIRRTADFFLAA